MASGAAILPLHVGVRSSRPTPFDGAILPLHSRSSAGVQELLQRSRSVSCALHRDHPFVSNRVLSSSFRRHRISKRELSPVLPVCQQPRSSSGKLAESTSPSPVVDHEHARGFDSSTSPSPFVRESKTGDFGMYSTMLGGLGLLAFAFHFTEASMAATAVKESSFPTVVTFAGAEPSNALSLPTWVIHVASVVEWATAMALVWKYGDTEGKSAWKGLTWGMVPLLGGAMCACTWHFFYNAESLEILVVLQAFLTVVGNFTLWAAAYRIYKFSQEKTTAD